MPIHLSTARIRLQSKVEAGIIWVLSLVTGYNVYLYATKQPTILSEWKSGKSG